MLNKLTGVILLLVMVSLISSCSPKKNSTTYYYQNEKMLDRIEESYKTLYQQAPFTIAFTDKKF